MPVVDRAAPGREPPPTGALEAMLPQLRERVVAGLARAGRPGNTGGDLLAKYMAMEKAFYDAGGMLVVGTDPTGGGDVVPGYANQRALQLLMEIGLTVEQAVEVATRNGAIPLQRADEIGTVGGGKRASGEKQAEPEEGNMQGEVQRVSGDVPERRVEEDIDQISGYRQASLRRM